MRSKLLGVTAAFVVVITAFFAVSVYYLYQHYSDTAQAERAGQAAVALNETAKLTERIQANPNDTEAVAALEVALDELGRLYTKPAAVNTIA